MFREKSILPWNPIICILFLIMLLGIISIYFCINPQHLFYLNNLIENLHLNSDILSDIIGFEGVLIGVSIPLCLQSVSKIVDEYGKDIAKYFVRELLYKSLFYLFPFNIVISMFLRLVKVENPFILFLMFLWTVVNLIVFLFFIKKAQKYITDTEDIIIKQAKKNAKRIFED
jgi:hypothetical protein